MRQLSSNPNQSYKSLVRYVELDSCNFYMMLTFKKKFTKVVSVFMKAFHLLNKIFNSKPQKRHDVDYRLRNACHTESKAET